MTLLSVFASEAKQSSGRTVDCRVAALLAKTMNGQLDA